MKKEIVDYYDDLAKLYDQDRFDNSYGDFIDKNERKILSKLLSDSKSGTIVDLACGTGRFLNFANIGVDASAQMIQVAKEKFPNKTLYVAEGANIPLADNSVDVIFSFHLFMHLDNEEIENILEECHRVLKRNGTMIFDIPSKKRRTAINYKKKNWHGSHSLSLNEINQIGQFKLKKSFGILLFPIHRLPKLTRPLFSGIDHFLANSILKEYSSYLIVELKKR